jgi:hypothetical protein
MKKKKNEFGEFNRTMGKLLSVTHNEIKAKLDEEKTAKKRKNSKISSAPHGVAEKD